MNPTHADERPAKKRRFFVPDAAVTRPNEHSSLDDIDAARKADPVEDSSLHAVEAVEGPEDGSPRSGALEGFDVELFTSVIGEQLPPAALRRLSQLSGKDVQLAINMYLDGSWKAAQPPSSSTGRQKPEHSSPLDSTAQRNGSDIHTVTEGKLVEKTPKSSLSAAPTDRSDKRYIGAFGVAGWATKSGAGLLRHEEKISIERSKVRPVTKPGRGGKPKVVASRKQDIVVRFTNSRGEEVGRLENDVAFWISALLDQKICSFEGHCVYAPDRLRTNDTVYLQLRCYLLKTAFEAAAFVKPEDNRETGLFEAKESEDERKLRVRQVALVKLFDEINLHPSRANATTEKHKRQGLLQAAEMAEQYDKKGSSNGVQEGEGSSSPSDNEEGQELEQDQLDSLYKKAQSFDFDTPEAEPAQSFVLDLRKYQRQALFWMMGKEKDEKQDHRELSMHPLWEEYTWPTKDVDGKELPEVAGQPNFYVNPYSGELSLDFPVQEQNCLGGILADEMGLGKTIEMLSLIHTHRAISATSNSNGNVATVNDLPRLPKQSSSTEKAPYTTLVVAPMSLLAQWQSEAEKASKPGSLRVMVYYGADKAVNLRNLCCEANAATAPNVIITSYGTVLSEFNSVVSLGGNRGSHGGLFSLEYFRIILDEAHYIKNRQSKTAKACYELSARHRWVLTGTPIVNRLEDLFSLVRFLRVEPWSNFSFWKTFITVPFESKDFIRALDVVQTVLEPLVLRRTKDMKTPDGEALVPLPPRNIDVVPIELSKAEREVYDHIYMRAKRTFNANVEAGTLMKSYTTIFAQILRLRQSCCHPVLVRNKTLVAEEVDAAEAADIANGLADDMDLQALIERFESAEGEEDANRFGANVLKQIQEERDDECPICSEEPMIEQAVTGCWHSACKQCLLDYIEHQRDKGEIARCWNCREPINARDVFEVIRHDPPIPEHNDDLYTSTSSAADNTPRISLRRISAAGSAKIQALLTQLKQIRRADPDCRSVVFSQFTSFLDLLGPALDRDGIPSLRFDGSMSQKQRAAVMHEFAAASPSRRGRVLLLSLRAGGVGLNLTCARRVFMMDPWWSFAVEAQAIDRVHRMGQTAPVEVVRYVVRDSIEEKMLKVQDRKKFIASSLGMMSEEDKKLQRIEDIKELLS